MDNYYETFEEKFIWFAGRQGGKSLPRYSLNRGGGETKGNLTLRVETEPEPTIFRWMLSITQR